MAPRARIITVALDMSKGFHTINIHTRIRKLLQTNIPDTIIKFITNYIKGPKAYTTYINHTSSQRQFKTGVLQGGVLSPTLFNIYTADITPPRAPVQVMAYADGITIMSIHTSTSAAKKYIQPYLHKFFARTKQSNLTLNPDKTTCTLFTSDPVEYKSNLDLKINNTALCMATHPKVLGLTLDPKLTYSTHISVQAHTSLQMINALTATWWGIQKETLMATYKTVMRPTLEYASSIWSPLASSTSINKQQVMQNWELPQDAHNTQGDLRKEPARWRSLLWVLGLVLYECLPPIPPSGTPIIGSNILCSCPWMALSSLQDRQYSYSSKWNNPDT